nr:hypothetical protein [Luteimonas abyssi]
MAGMLRLPSVLRVASMTVMVVVAARLGVCRRVGVPAVPVVRVLAGLPAVAAPQGLPLVVGMACVPCMVRMPVRSASLSVLSVLSVLAVGIVRLVPCVRDGIGMRRVSVRLWPRVVVFVGMRCGVSGSVRMRGRRCGRRRARRCMAGVFVACLLRPDRHRQERGQRQGERGAGAQARRAGADRGHVHASILTSRIMPASM